jgi:hypothetical protein
MPPWPRRAAEPGRGCGAEALSTACSQGSVLSVVAASIEHVFDTEAEERFRAGPQAGVRTALTQRLDALGPGAVLASLLETVDPARVTPAERVALLRAAGRQEAWLFARRASVLATMGSLDREGRPCDDEDWAREDTATALRISPLSANNQLHDARHLVTHLPATLKALSSGRLGVPHARTLADVTGALSREQADAVEQRVLGRGLSQTPGALRAAARRAVAAVDPAGFGERARLARAAKTISRENRGDGTGELRLGMPAEDLQLVWGYVTAKAEEPVAVGDERSMDTRRVDALIDLVRTALHGGPSAAGPAGTASPDAPDAPTAPGGTGGTAGQPAAAPPSRRCGRCTDPLIQIVIDLPDLLALRDQPATLLGYGPLPADLVRTWAADATWQRLVRDPHTGHLLDLGTVLYRPSTGLKRYLQARDRTCRFPGCTRKARACDLDHTVPHGEAGGATAACNLACLCRRHHRLKTFTDWHYQLHPDGSITWTDPHGTQHHEPPPDAHPDT